jgi:hypothetical protein
LYILEVQGFVVLFLLFGFFLPSVAPEGKYYVWSFEGLPSTFGASGRHAIVTGVWQQAAASVQWWPAGRGSMELADRLFSQ